MACLSQQSTWHDNIIMFHLTWQVPTIEKLYCCHADRINFYKKTVTLWKIYNYVAWSTFYLHLKSLCFPRLYTVKEIIREIFRWQQYPSHGYLVGRITTKDGKEACWRSKYSLFWSPSIYLTYSKFVIIVNQI